MNFFSAKFSVLTVVLVFLSESKITIAISCDISSSIDLLKLFLHKNVIYFRRLQPKTKTTVLTMPISISTHANVNACPG